jgi:hypothetical protein
MPTESRAQMTTQASWRGAAIAATCFRAIAGICADDVNVASQSLCLYAYIPLGTARLTGKLMEGGDQLTRDNLMSHAETWAFTSSPIDIRTTLIRSAEMLAARLR